MRRKRRFQRHGDDACRCGYNRGLRGVAQPGSATALGAVGRTFESSHPDQKQKGRQELVGLFPCGIDRHGPREYAMGPDTEVAASALCARLHMRGSKGRVHRSAGRLPHRNLVDIGARQSDAVRAAMACRPALGTGTCRPCRFIGDPGKAPQDMAKVELTRFPDLVAVLAHPPLCVVICSGVGVRPQAHARQPPAGSISGASRQ